ncbi:MAG TPA: hypothetical protein VF934_13355 [Burkholderiales bacterium]
MSESRRRGIFALIRSRQDALNVVTDTSIVFLLVAVILAALYLIEGEKTLLDVGLFGFLGALLWRFKSPAAAITLLLVSVMRLFVTLAQILDTGDVNWIFVVITAIAIVASIRAAEATLKLIGRFAEER